ncbi:hypothetical protein Asulf_01219 [Archaeoglobus sulfaticallidus PM70-1]|uniref:Response regulatory domain-containing protein n=1 Tax=Archaeoglobus sulfaticallidus PM70-1 TaxID=387631 RepID=N0BFY8_9EURY|nr:response regulator [Archaeoglobus sulfaticallidus]AGK61217.1 hypothetical protein Asulf_01219 [Archaeoglobus sulfaticallidus PM70-1]
MRVLIVDDDSGIREILRLMLSEYTVLEASNGDEAVKHYKNFKPDVVIMDAVMPVMDGVAATRRILEIDPNAKVVALTAYYTTKAREMLEAGSVEALEKPFSKKIILEIVRKYCRYSNY